MHCVMLVGDQPAILAGMTRLIDNAAIAKVTASATDDDGVMLTALENRLDLILLDVSPANLSAVDITRRQKSAWPDAPVLAVSAHADPVCVRGMIAAGANGYMLKDRVPQEIADALTSLMQGGRWIPPDCHGFAAGQPSPAPYFAREIEKIISLADMLFGYRVLLSTGFEA